MKKYYEIPAPLAKKAMREADSLIRAAHALGIFADGDPNNPKYNNGINYVTGKPVTLFGYETDMFMAKQNRTVKP